MRLKKLAIPSTLCSRCCSRISPGKPHPADCHKKSFNNKRDGTPKQISFLCTVHPSEKIHYLLCSKCGKDPVLPKPVPVVAIRATPLHPLPRPEVIPIKKVVFLTEAVTLIARNGRKQKVLFVYDSLSGCSLASNIDHAFNWAPPGQQTETFSLSTVGGSDSCSLPVVEYVVLKGKSVASGSRKVTLQCYLSDFPVIPIVEPPSSLNQYHFGNVGVHESRSLMGRIMVGAEYATLFPVRTTLPCLDNDECAGLVGYVSRLTGQWLLSGNVSNPGKSHRVPVVPNLMTIPKTRSQGARRKGGRQDAVVEEIITGVGNGGGGAND